MKIAVSQGNPIDVPIECEPCECGLPVEWNHGYGRTPYSINCSECGKYYQNKITNCTAEHAVKSFNQFRKANVNEFEFKVIQFRNEKP